MGMAASQARLLSITARLSDNELHSQKLANSKVRLADKTQQASKDYIDALNTQCLTFTSYDSYGNAKQTKLTPSLIYTYSDLKNQYGIVNTSNQLLVSSTDWNNYLASANLEEFLKINGVELKSSVDSDKMIEQYGVGYEVFAEALNNINLDTYNYNNSNVATWDAWSTNVNSNISELISASATINGGVNISTGETLEQVMKNISNVSQPVSYPEAPVYSKKPAMPSTQSYPSKPVYDAKPTYDATKKLTAPVMNVAPYVHPEKPIHEISGVANDYLYSEYSSISSSFNGKTSAVVGSSTIPNWTYRYFTGTAPEGNAVTSNLTDTACHDIIELLDPIVWNSGNPNLSGNKLYCSSKIQDTVNTRLNIDENPNNDASMLVFPKTSSANKQLYMTKNDSTAVGYFNNSTSAKAQALIDALNSMDEDTKNNYYNLITECYLATMSKYYDYNTNVKFGIEQYQNGNINKSQLDSLYLKPILSSQKLDYNDNFTFADNFTNTVYTYEEGRKKFGIADGHTYYNIETIDSTIQIEFDTLVNALCNKAGDDNDPEQGFVLPPEDNANYFKPEIGYITEAELAEWQNACDTVDAAYNAAVQYANDYNAYLDTIYNAYSAGTDDKFGTFTHSTDVVKPVAPDTQSYTLNGVTTYINSPINGDAYLDQYIEELDKWVAKCEQQYQDYMYEYNRVKAHNDLIKLLNDAFDSKGNIVDEAAVNDFITNNGKYFDNTYVTEQNNVINEISDEHIIELIERYGISYVADKYNLIDYDEIKDILRTNVSHDDCEVSPIIHTEAETLEESDNSLTKYLTTLNNWAKECQEKTAQYNKDVAIHKATFEEWKEKVQKELDKISCNFDMLMKEEADMSASQTQWYVNLWHRINGASESKDKAAAARNCKVLDDNLLTSADWLKFALEQGVVTLEQVQKTDNADEGTGLTGRAWKGVIYTSCTDINSVDDEVAIAKAEAEYTKALNEIEAEDKKLDNDIKKLDTEHSALVAEHDSIKEVLKKNVENSFKAFS